MSIRREVFRLLLIPLRRIPSDRRYQCGNPECGHVPRTLTREQAWRLAGQRTTACRRCGASRLTIAAVV